MTVAVTAIAFARPAGAWRRHGIALAITLAVLLLLFRRDVIDLVTIWWTSTTFGHCLFIGPVIAWLVWNRRHELAQLTPAAWAPGLFLVAAGGFAWLLGEAASVNLVRQVGLVLMLQGATVTLLGPQVARGLLFPLGYAFFLVPFGDGLEGPLQDVTVRITMPLLHLFGVPAQVDGVLITIPDGYFEVAEACSGAKFVIAMVAYGALVANTCFRSLSRRAAFMVVAVIVPVLANGVRAFGTIYAAHLTSVAAATGFDHIVYGWLFFAAVMAAVIALGWRWFDRAPDHPAFDPALWQAPTRHLAPLPLAALLAMGTATVFPVWAKAMDAQQAQLPAQIALPAVQGWQRVPLSTHAPWAPYYPGADHQLLGRYADAEGNTVDLGVAVYGQQQEGKELISFGTGPLREEDVWVRVADLPAVGGGAAMRVRAPGPVERWIVTWYRVGDTLTADPRRVKIETLRAKLLGAPQRAVAIHLSAEVQAGRDPRAALTRFLAALGPLDRLADHAAGL